MLGGIGTQSFHVKLFIKLLSCRSDLCLLGEDLAVHEPGQGAEPDVVAVEVHDERGQGQPIQLLDKVGPDAVREGTLSHEWAVS